VGEGCDDGNPTPGDGCHHCRRIEQVSTSGNHACVRIDDGSIKCWGGNYEGQLGLGDQSYRGDFPGEMGDSLRTVDLGTGRGVKLVHARSFRTCAILENDSVKCWGQNTSSQLGLGDSNSRGDASGEMGDNLPEFDLGTGRAATALAMGGVHTCALLTNGTVKCWGINIEGATGRPVDDPTRPVGDALVPVNLGNGRTARMITAGNTHTCALLDNGSIKCWGGNDHGQLGLGDTDSRGDTTGELGDALPSVDLGAGRTALAVVAGDLHTCAILEGGKVKCWGSNDQGQLGLGDMEDRGDGLDAMARSEMGDNLPEVELGIGYAAVALGAGTAHTCGLFDNGAVKCWGSGSANGLGTGQSRGTMAGQMGDALPVVALGRGRSVRELSTGAYSACVLLDTYAVKCWGDNGFGQLGLGDRELRGDAMGEMGDNLPTLLLP
jgi:alpha-tubulin suppressor-like RCC1 family protein